MARAAVLLTALLGGALAAQAPDFLRPDPARPASPALARALAGLRAPALGSHIVRLADPALEGRGLGGPELERVLGDLARRLAAAGVRPFGERGPSGRPGWFQRVPLRAVANPTATLTLSVPGRGEVRFTAGAEAILPKLPPGVRTLPLRAAGHGIQEPAAGQDDLAGRDLASAAALVDGGLPAGPAWARPDLRARWAAEDADDRYDPRLDLLQARGGAALIALEPDFPEAAKARRRAAETGFLEDGPAAPLLLRLPARAAPALAALGLGPGGAPEGARAVLESGGTLRAFTSRNVLGLIPGSDPKLRREAVVIGAHADHLGRVDGVVIPGADDNASGVAALLEVARVLAAAPRRPKRSVVVAFWTGEEEGKFGSNHYVRHPRWPLAGTVAYLNLDMIGHPWTPEEVRKLVAEAAPAPGPEFLAGLRTEDLIEPGLASGAPWLGPVLARAGDAAGSPLHLDWTDGRHGGSDYRAFARAGVPFVRFFGNYFPDYHRPGDTADRTDPAQVLKVARLALATAWILADR